MSRADHPALVALDWGTSSLRAWLLAGPGKAVDTRSAPWGIMHLPEGGFSGALQSLCGDWLQQYPCLPVIASGMVGSAQGWLEVPYVGTPAASVGVAAGLRHAALPDGRNVAIVPGVLQDNAHPNVMRGEETQVFGAWELLQDPPGKTGKTLMVLPGTHSKWVTVEQGHITRFMTAMTGELYAVLRRHSLLGRLMVTSEEFDYTAFERGLEESQRSQGVMFSLFSARTLGLARRLEGAQLGDYLSGLLIGHEIREARLAFAAELAADYPLPVIGTDELRHRYHIALGWHGISVHEGDFSQATQAGLWHIARNAGWIT
jgi:2-dehydro-3-deoxygalactonokinase